VARDSNKMGQSGTPGEPDPGAMAAVAAANAVPDGAEVVGEEQFVEVLPVESPATEGELKEQLLRLAKTDPAFAKQLVEASGIVVPAGQGAPSGVYSRNYRQERQLAVLGGVEVEHPPEFEPKPPAFIKMFLRADGTETDHAGPLIETRKRPVQLIVDGKPAQSIEGFPVMTDELVEVVVDKGAAIGPDGRPVKTDLYKRFLDAKMDFGARLDSDVVSGEIAAKVQAADGSAAVSLNTDGEPAVVGGGMNLE